MVLTRRRKEGVQNPKNLANVICTCPLTRRRAKSRNLALGSHSTEKSEWPMNNHDIVRLMRVKTTDEIRQTCVHGK